MLFYPHPQKSLTRSDPSANPMHIFCISNANFVILIFANIAINYAKKDLQHRAMNT